MTPEYLHASPELIEGLGPRRGEALEAAGIVTVADVVACSPRRLRSAVRGVSLGQADAWRAAAWLMQVPKVDQHLAEILVGAGLDTLERVADRSLRSLERIVLEGVKARKMAEMPSLYDLAEAQRSAWKLMGKGVLVGRVLAWDGSAVAGVAVVIASKTLRTNEAGRFAFVGLPAGRHRLHVDAGVPMPRTCEIVPDGLRRLTSIRIPRVVEVAAQPSLTEADGSFIFQGRGQSLRLSDITVGDLPDDTYLVLRQMDSGGHAKLVHLNKRLAGSQVLVERLSVDRDSLPAGASEGTLLHYVKGAFELSESTLREIAARRLAVTRVGRP